jgi:hypothetical protein
MLQLILGSIGYILYLGFFLSFISKILTGLLKLVFSLPIFLPAVVCYLFAPMGNLFFGSLTAILLYLAFFTSRESIQKLFLSIPFFGPAILIYLFAPVYKILFSCLWIIVCTILFFMMIRIALRNFV